MLAAPSSTKSVAALWRERLESRPNDPLLRIGDAVLDAATVEEAAARLSGGLLGAGVHDGSQIVAQLAPSSYESVVEYLGCSRIGVPFCSVNTSFHGYLLRFVLEDLNSPVVFCSGDLLPRILELDGPLEFLKLVVVHGAGAIDERARAETRFDVVDFGTFLDTAAAPAATPDGREPNAIIYTSGTTGPSKGVIISNALAVNKALDFGRICDLTSDDIMYAPLPLFHETGLLKAVLGSIAAGGSVVIRERFSTSQFWPDVRAHGITVSVGFPTMQTWLMGAEPSPADRDHTLTRVLSMPNPEFESRFGVWPVASYGTTEITSAFHIRRRDPVRIGTCGRLSRDWEARLVDDDGREVPDGAVGEILLRPKAPGRLMSGYLHQADATARAFEDLWYRPGDLAMRDSEGFYYYKGRKKEVIRRRGENISAWDVERILQTRPDVDTAAALAVHRQDGDDDLWIVVVPAEGAVIDPAELHAYCRAEMPDFMVPRYVDIRHDVPRTPATARVEKRKLALAGPAPACFDAGEHGRRGSTVPNKRND